MTRDTLRSNTRRPENLFNCGAFISASFLVGILRAVKIAEIGFPRETLMGEWKSVEV